MGMTDQQALDLMMNEAYQEKEEATAKLQRAHSRPVSCRRTMPAGKAGSRSATVPAKAGQYYSSKEFHERALKESAVPLPVLDRLLRSRYPCRRGL